MKRPSSYTWANPWETAVDTSREVEDAEWLTDLRLQAEQGRYPKVRRMSN